MFIQAVHYGWKAARLAHAGYSVYRAAKPYVAGGLAAYQAGKLIRRGYKGIMKGRMPPTPNRSPKRRRTYRPKRRTRAAGGRPVTKYHDVSVTRNRSRRPRGRKMVLMKTIQSVINRAAGLNCYIQTHFGNATASATALSNSSGYDEFQIGCSNSTSNRFNDLYQLLLSKRDVFPGGTAPPDKVLTKFFLQSMVMDVKITNADADDDMWIDVYHYIYRKDCEDDSNMVTTITDSYDSTYEMDSTITFLPALGFPGTTPYDYPLVGSYLRIIKKQRMLLQAGANTGFTVKRRVNRVLNSDIVNDFNSMRGLTYGIFIKFQNATLQSLGGNTYAPKSSAIDTYVTNTYHYRQIQNNYGTQGYFKTTQ